MSATEEGGGGGGGYKISDDILLELKAFWMHLGYEASRV